MGAKLQKKNSNNSMGLFKSRDKSKDRSATNVAASRPLSEAPSATTNISNPASNNSLQNSFNTSTAPTSTSNLSNNPNSSTNVSTVPKIEGQPAGTIVTTTTTTTTTTTVVRQDGTTGVQTHQYDPSTDPPPNTNVVQRPDATTIQSPNQSSTGSTNVQGASGTSRPSPIPESPASAPAEPLTRQLTGGNRTIPTRSPLRNARGTSPSGSQSQSTFQPPPPQRNSAEYVSPVSTTQAQPQFPPQPKAQAPAAPPAEISSEPIELSTSPPVHSQSQSQYFNTPSSPTRTTNSNNIPAPNFSRPSAPTPNTAATHDISNTSTKSQNPTATLSSPLTSHPVTAPSPNHAAAPIPRTKPSLSSTLKGLHGAGDALRGQINYKVAQATHDTAEIERQRAIREKGMMDYQESGLHLESKVGHGREGGFRERAEQRLRRKSIGNGNQVYGSAGPEGLRPLGEMHGE